jgi:transposase
MSDDNTRIALMLQKQQQDEEEIKDLKKRVDAIDHQVFAGKVVLLTLIGLGTFFGWLVNAGDKVRSWFH